MAENTELASGPTLMTPRRLYVRIGLAKGGVKDVNHVARAFPGRPRAAAMVVVRLIPEMWASLAITAMWVAVFITAIWGPDARFSSNDGNSSTIPTAVFVTVFAFLGTWVVARYGFRQQRKQ